MSADAIPAERRWWSIKTIAQYFGQPRDVMLQIAHDEDSGFPSPTRIPRAQPRWRAGDVIAWAATNKAELPLDESPEATALYRHFDLQGRLLYVGIASNVLSRMKSHRHRSHWHRRIVRIELTWFPSRAAAKAAEAEAIARERPMFNLQRP